ncbi:MAG: hypothetical protein JO356_01055 [Acidobacteria bacterium]|nr:hypothetical protein [Acidobacteriota bacterium]
MASDLAALIADKDFQALAPGDQRAVLSRATGDQSFGSLSDEDTQQYVSRATQKVQLTRPDLFAPPSAAGAPPSRQVAARQMQQSRLGKQDNSDPDLQRMNRNIYAADAASNPTPEDALMGAGALAATTGVGAAGRVALPFLGRQAAQHPVITAMVAQQAVHQARQIPGVGRFIPSAAEWLPFLFTGGKGEGAAAEAEAETAAPQVRAAQPSPVEAPAPTPQAQLPWMPPKAQMQFSPGKGPLPGSAEDIAETAQIQDQVRNQAEGESEALRRQGEAEGWARNTRARTPKSVLTGTADRPVKYTKTPGVRSGGTDSQASGSGDLTDVLQRSVAQAKARRGQ